jgi:predicted ATPase/DNA-binding winged helix-turn-helix (wHTH) protein/Tfp pilus assembly protein PilF
LARLLRERDARVAIHAVEDDVEARRLPRAAHAETGHARRGLALVGEEPVGAVVAIGVENDDEAVRAVVFRPHLPALAHVELERDRTGGEIDVGHRHVPVEAAALATRVGLVRERNVQIAGRVLGLQAGSEADGSAQDRCLVSADGRPRVGALGLVGGRVVPAGRRGVVAVVVPDVNFRPAAGDHEGEGEERMARIHAFLPGPSGEPGANVAQSLATNGYKLHQGAGRIPLSGCVVDLEHERVLRGDDTLPLTTREARLLRYLWEREGQDITRCALLVEVWGYSKRARSRAVDATVQRLRAKIERDPTAPDHLLTVWGSGYRLAGPGIGVPAPSASADLVGRDLELRTVREAFDEGKRLVTLIGPSGVGKTRLAREAMASLGPDPCFCALENATDEATLVGAVAVAMGATGADGIPTDLLRARGDLLLVLDNVEQVIAPAARVAVSLLSRAPRLRILATSREALGVENERVVELGSLSVDAGVALLGARAREWAGRDALRAITVRLEGMPLALELAAGLAPVLTPEALLARLDARLDVLVSRRRDVPARHRSLRDAVAWSFALLDRDDALVVSDLAVFDGGFSIESAEGVLGRDVDAVSALGRLRARSLLRPIPGREHRLGLYDAVRIYAREEMSFSPRLEEARERHRLWYANEARRRFDPAGCFPDPHDVAFVADEIENIVSACRRSLERDPEDAAALAFAASFVLASRGPVDRVVDLLDACLGVPLSARARAHLLRARANALRLLGREEEGAADARAAIAAGAAAGDLVLEGRATSLLAMIEQHYAARDQVLATHERAIALTQRAGDRAYEASALGNYGTALWSDDHFDAAGRAYARSLQIHRQLGNARSASIILSNLGLHDLDEGHFERARFRLGQALAEQRRLGELRHVGATLGHLAIHALVVGDCRSARDRAEEGVRILSSVGERECRAHEILVLGKIAWELGDRTRARHEAERARDGLGNRPESLAALHLLDLVLRIDDGETDEAEHAVSGLVDASSNSRTRALGSLARGFLFVADAIRNGDAAAGERARAMLELVPAGSLLTTTAAWRRELARRVRSLQAGQHAPP